tara:strand:- start:131 stop:376 length:246 start_codon:yes stop_codon:yes gene_type:complete
MTDAITVKELVKRNIESNEHNHQQEKADVTKINARLDVLETLVSRIKTEIQKQLPVDLDQDNSANDSNPSAAAEGPSDDSK